MVSIKRIQHFIETPELEATHVSLIDESESNAGAAIVVSRATCHWGGGSGTKEIEVDIENPAANPTGLTTALDDINLSFDMGSLTCIVGDVGSGKSALLQLLLGELPPTRGYLSYSIKDSTIAYAQQQPFVSHGTVRENILFGQEYQSEKYQSVVNACGLDQDFQQLSEGDQTFLSSEDVLSGGQRARLALARAFYRDADILLLDDSLSAGKLLMSMHFNTSIHLDL